MPNISHKSGGRITAITAIAHETHGGRVGWHFVGKVQWDEGGSNRNPDATNRDPDRLYQISPIMICTPPNGDRTGMDKALAALEEYLRINGEWVGHDWKPHEPSGRAEVNL